MKESVAGLLQQCVAARVSGADFPTVWQNILRNHPLVIGPPIQRLEGQAPVLEIRLITGQRLIYDDKGFALR